MSSEDTARNPATIEYDKDTLLFQPSTDWNRSNNSPGVESPRNVSPKTELELEDRAKRCRSEAGSHVSEDSYPSRPSESSVSPQIPIEEPGVAQQGVVEELIQLQITAYLTHEPPFHPRR